jgi:hypothetical protein
MAVEDDVRRLSQMEAIYLGWTVGGLTVWHEGRLQRANDGTWLFRSVSRDGTIVAFQIGTVGQNWSSQDTPADGIAVNLFWGDAAQMTAQVQLRQQLPQQVTN